MVHCTSSRIFSSHTHLGPAPTMFPFPLSEWNCNEKIRKAPHEPLQRGLHAHHGGPWYIRLCSSLFLGVSHKLNDFKVHYGGEGTWRNTVHHVSVLTMPTVVQLHKHHDLWFDEGCLMLHPYEKENYCMLLRWKSRQRASPFVRLFE